MRQPNTRENIEEILRNKTRIDEITGCWLYGSINDYVKVRFYTSDVGVHRIAAHLYLGFELFGDLQVNHTPICPNKNCWNPEHLYIGTQKENVADSMLIGFHQGNKNQAKTHCPQGHPYDKINSAGRRICTICQKEQNKKSQQSDKRKEYMKAYNKRYYTNGKIGGK